MLGYKDPNYYDSCFVLVDLGGLKEVYSTALV